MNVKIEVCVATDRYTYSGKAGATRIVKTLELDLNDDIPSADVMALAPFVSSSLASAVQAYNNERAKIEAEVEEE